MAAFVAERLTPRTPELEVCGSSLASRVVSLDEELYSTLSLFTLVHKWVLATSCWGVTLAIPDMLYAKETGIRSGQLCLWLA